MTRARDVADTQENLGGAVPPFTAGKNIIINGDMRVSQRGTSFTIASTAYTLDRFLYDVASAVPTGTVSQQTFTPGTAPVAGYEAQSFLRVNNTANNGCTAFNLAQRVEDVRAFAGQTVTFSFYAKADAAATMTTVALQQVFGSGGSGTVTTILTMSSMTLGTGWTRYTGTIAVPSISGKTIGTGSYVNVVIVLPNAAGVFRNGTYDFWGWQLEAGSTATPFQTATGTVQGELAACKYYYDKRGGLAGTGTILNNALSNAAGTNAAFTFPITMRVAPTAVEFSNLRLSDTSSGFTVSSVTLTNCTPTTGNVNVATTGMTGFRSCYLDSSATGNFIAFSAEL